MANPHHPQQRHLPQHPQMHHHQQQPPHPHWRDSRIPSRTPGRDESMGPPRELPRHRSVSRLHDAWRSTGGSPMPASAFGSPGPSSAAYPMPMQAHGGNYAVHAQAPMRYYTPSLSMGATPGASGSSWGNGHGNVLPDQYHPVPVRHDPYQLAYRADSVDPYAKYQPGPRSSSIGPWLRGTQPASHRERSGSVWSSHMGYPEAPGPVRTHERYSPAYPRAAPYPLPSRPIPEHYIPSISSSQSRAFSELPGAQRGPPRAEPPMHTPAPTYTTGLREVGSAPGAFRGPSNRALNYIRQATESATIAGSPVLRARRPAVPRPSLPEVEEVEPKPEPAATPAPGLIFDSDSQQDDDDEDIELVEQQTSPQSVTDDNDGEQGDGDGGEVADFDDEEEIADPDDEGEVADFDDEDAPTAVSTPLRQGSKKSAAHTTQKASKVASSSRAPDTVAAPLIPSPKKSSPKKPSPKKPSPKKTEVKKPTKSAAATASAPSHRTEASRPENMRALSNWFLFAQQTKKLPKQVAKRLRSSPFSRVLGTDDLSRAGTWVRVAGELNKDDIKQFVDGQHVDPAGYTWETSLVTEARHTTPGDGINDGTIIITTSSGTEYALLGPMNVAMTIERFDLSASFWQEFSDTGGLAEEGWEALILRALLTQSSEGQQQPPPDRQAAEPRVVPQAKQRPVAQSSLRPPSTGTSKGHKSQKHVTVLDVAETESSRPSVLAGKPRSPSKTLKPSSRRSLAKPSPKPSGRRSPVIKGRRSRELAGLVASPFGGLTVVRQALHELGMVMSDLEDESDTTEEVSHSYFTRRKGTADSSPNKAASTEERPVQRSLSAVTNMKEPRLPGEMSDVSDSADEWREDRQPRSRAASQSDVSSDEEQQLHSRKRAASDADRGVVLLRSKRVRTLTSNKKWWEVPSPPRSTTKPVPRALVKANRRTVVPKRRST
ncbi:hypothetical protein A4X09_0g4973 [Tilletia walkeri]|uniref:Uncharacterized protein n=1 Tax=Tilletia walkeri TaxID=117179 RepID=A0A8X7N8B3_9BASI|nr:hypothetical protein A4X09_0g4973 [Tilletia walkeri]